jgi:hypothetical protein
VGRQTTDKNYHNMNEIKYLNEYLEPINREQAIQSNEFIQQKTENGKVKIEETYKNGILSYVNYYLNNNENENEIRQLYPNIGLTFYKNEIVNGIYKKYNVEAVDLNGIVESKYVEVYGDSPYPIYFEAIDINTNERLSMFKAYYDIEKKIDYEFSYDNTTGNFKELTVLDPYNYVDTSNHIILPSQVGIGYNDYDFVWTGFEYYQFATPILPTNPIA